MPEICRFYGIVIRMFLIDREHPPKHIHIKYGEHEAVMELMNLNIIEGVLPKNVSSTRSGMGRDSSARVDRNVGDTRLPLYSTSGVAYETEAL